MLRGVRGGAISGRGASTRVARARRGGRGRGRARRVRGHPGHNSPAGGAGVGVRWPAELAPRRARAADYALIDGRRRRGPGRFHADWGHARRASAPSSYPKCHRHWRDTHDTEEGSGIDAAERAGRCLCCLGGVRGRVLSRKCWNEHQHGRWCVSAGPRGPKSVKIVQDLVYPATHHNGRRWRAPAASGDVQ